MISIDLLGWTVEDLLGELGIIVVVPPPLPVSARVHSEMERQQLVLGISQRDNSWKTGDYQKVSVVWFSQDNGTPPFPRPGWSRGLGDTTMTHWSNYPVCMSGWGKGYRRWILQCLPSILKLTNSPSVNSLEV